MGGGTARRRCFRDFRAAARRQPPLFAKLRPVPLDRVRQALGQRGARGPTGCGAEAGNIRLQVHHLVRPIGHFTEAQRQGGIDQVANLPHDLPNGLGPAAAEVEDALGLRGLGYGRDRLGRILDVKIVPKLFPGGQSGLFPSQQLLDERGNHVVGVVPGTVQTEDADPSKTHPRLPGQIAAHLQRTQLGCPVSARGLGPIAFREDAVLRTVFGLRTEGHEGLAAGLGRQRYQHGAALHVARDLFGMVAIGAGNAVPAGVKDRIRSEANNLRRGGRGIFQVAKDARHARQHLFDAPRAGRIAAQHGHRVSLTNQQLRQTGAHESRCAGNQSPHAGTRSENW